MSSPPPLATVLVKPGRHQGPVRQVFHGREPFREPLFFPVRRFPLVLFFLPPFVAFQPVNFGDL